ncbi:MAG: hypothetical protein ACHQEM_02515 [Chitinophagales bacterium]
MKKILAILSLTIGLSMLAQAQCDKKMTWTASKAEFLDESGAVQDTKDVTVVVETSSKYLKITHSDDLADSLTGNVKDLKCDWALGSKNGKIEYSCDLIEKSGESNNSKLTVESKDAKVMILLHIERNDGKKMDIRIPVDSFKESS